MAGNTNGVHADPSGVFGRVGQTVQIGSHSVTVRLLTNRDMKRQQQIIGGMTYLGTEGSIGDAYYAYAVGNEDAWQSLATWLGIWTEPPVDAEMLDDATPDETVALIDAIFEQSGMLWLRRSVGNARLAMMRNLERLQIASSEVSPESDSTSSTS